MAHFSFQLFVQSPSSHNWHVEKVGEKTPPPFFTTKPWPVVTQKSIWKIYAHMRVITLDHPRLRNTSCVSCCWAPPSHRTVGSTPSWLLTTQTDRLSFHWQRVTLPSLNTSNAPRSRFFMVDELEKGQLSVLFCRTVPVQRRLFSAKSLQRVVELKK